MSKVTGNVEQIPVAISLLGAPGTFPPEVPYQRNSSLRLIKSATGRDLQLMDIARNCLVKAGRPTSVLAGKKLFP